ncbi:hypothetical protein IC582_002689 [Cucumis melo]
MLMQYWLQRLLCCSVDVPWMTVAVQAEETVEDSTTWSFDAID